MSDRYHMYLESELIRSPISPSKALQLITENEIIIEELMKLMKKNKNRIFNNNQRHIDIIKTIKNSNRQFKTYMDLKQIEENLIRIKQNEIYQKRVQLEKEKKMKEQKEIEEEKQKQITENYRYLTINNINHNNASSYLEKQFICEHSTKSNLTMFNFYIQKADSSKRPIIHKAIELKNNEITIGEIKKLLFSKYGLMFNNVCVISNIKISQFNRVYTNHINDHYKNLNDDTRLVIDSQLRDHLMECPSLIVIKIIVNDIDDNFNITDVDVKLGKEIQQVQHQISDMREELDRFKNEIMSILKQIKNTCIV